MDARQRVQTEIDLHWMIDPDDRAMECWRILWDKLIADFVEQETEVHKPSDDMQTWGLENRDLVGDT